MNVLLAINSLAQQKYDCQPFKVDVFIENIDTGQLRILYKGCNSLGAVVNASLKNGRAQFEGKMNSIAEILLFTDVNEQNLDGESIIRFIAEPGTTKLSFKLKEKAPIDIRIKGGVAQAEKERWTLKNESYLNSSNYNEIIKEVNKYIHKNPSSYFSAYLLRRYYTKLSIDSLERHFNNLPLNIQKSSFGREILDEMLRLTKDEKIRNKYLPAASSEKLDSAKSIYDLALPNENNEAVSFSSFKGKKLVLSFWASWCAPCIRKIPELLMMIENTQNDPVEFLSISTDSDFGVWKNAIKKYRYPGYHLHDNEKIMQYYFGIIAYPTYILIDPNGVELTRSSSITDLSKLINTPDKQ